jgi:hypothetical protein
MLEEHLLPKADQLDRIARESKLIQRSSHKFSAAGFLISLLKAVIKGDTSLNHLVMHLAGFVPATMTRQGMFQRFGPASSRFLLGVIREVLTQRFPAAADILREGQFRRVIVEDSMVVSMAKSNSGNFPNNGNRHEMTAGCKCLLMADLLTGKPLDFSSMLLVKPISPWSSRVSIFAAPMTSSFATWASSASTPLRRSIAARHSGSAACPPVSRPPISMERGSTRFSRRRPAIASISQ